MARAHAVYIVMDAGNPVLSFTVKHECKTWLKRNPSKSKRQIWRLPDGGRTDNEIAVYSEPEFLDD